MVESITYVSGEEIPSPLSDAISREIEQVTPSDYTCESSSGPILTTFETLQDEPALNEELELAVENDLFTLVVPPVEEEDMTTTVPIIDDDEITIRHSSADGIRIGPQIFSDTPERELSVGTIGYFESYSGRNLGRDRNDRPILIEFRQTSTAGGILFTTVALNDLAVTGNEQHRQDFVIALLTYLTKAIKEATQVEEAGSIDKSPNEESESDVSVPPNKYDAGLLTLYYYINSDQTVELSSGLPEIVLPAGISADFTDEEWERFIQAAERNDLISESGLHPDVVSETVDERNLRSFARRLNI